MKKIIQTILVANLFFGVAFAVEQSYSPYIIGQSLGKIAYKSFSLMDDQELVKKDFVLGLDETLLNKKADVKKISDESSYEVGMIVATQYKIKLKKMIDINETNMSELVKGFNSTVDNKNDKLTDQDKQVLKNFKISNDDE